MAERAVGYVWAGRNFERLISLGNFLDTVPLQSCDVKDTRRIGGVAPQPDTLKSETEARVAAQLCKTNICDPRRGRVVLQHLRAG